MASGNRVEDLENRVKELEATVSGLTDELVETKERLRTLEEEVDPDVDSSGDIIEPEPTSTGPSGGSTTGENSASSSDSESTAEGDKATEEQDEDNSDSELGDDIIVA